MDFQEIAHAWITAKNPSESIKQLANKRVEICNKCEFKKEIIQKIELSHICSKCGCPIKKKIFSPKKGACPDGRWDNIDTEYMKIKNTKTTI